MAERKAYTPGTPSWVDLGVYDTQAMARFYGALFGWQADIDASPEAGGYGMFKLRGRNVAGIGPQINPGPPFWAVYVSVADADVTANKVSAHRGSVLAGPMDVLDAGRMAVAQDSVGSYVSLWQPKAHLGAELVNEPGAFIWNELATATCPRPASSTRRSSAGVYGEAQPVTKPSCSPSRARSSAVRTRRVTTRAPAGSCGSPWKTATRLLQRPWSSAARCSRPRSRWASGGELCSPTRRARRSGSPLSGRPPPRRPAEPSRLCRGLPARSQPGRRAGPCPLQGTTRTGRLPMASSRRGTPPRCSAG